MARTGSTRSLRQSSELKRVEPSLSTPQIPLGCAASSPRRSWIKYWSGRKSTSPEIQIPPDSASATLGAAPLRQGGPLRWIGSHAACRSLATEQEVAQLRVINLRTPPIGPPEHHSHSPGRASSVDRFARSAPELGDGAGRGITERDQPASPLPRTTVGP